MMVHAATHGNGSSGSKPHCGGCSNRGSGCGNPNNPDKDHQCQVCEKLDHTALRC
jgi:hypothetical protein